MAEEKKNPIIVVLKIEMDCEGCGDKIAKLARSFSGVESASFESSIGKLTVMGTMSPNELRDFIARKTKKKAEVISPLPKQDDNKENKNESNKQSNGKNTPNKNELSSTVIKMSLHCQGCIEKIHKIVLRTKGVVEVKINREKETITVIGVMNEKDLVNSLKEKFKRNVEVLRDEKPKEKNKKEKNSGVGGTEQQNAGGLTENDNSQTVQISGNRLASFGTSSEYGYFPQYGHGYEYPPHLKFNDENPNACAVM